MNKGALTQPKRDYLENKQEQHIAKHNNLTAVIFLFQLYHLVNPLCLLCTFLVIVSDCRNHSEHAQCPVLYLCQWTYFNYTHAYF